MPLAAARDALRFQRTCDFTVIGAILFLIVFTPMAFGSVHPWARALMQAAIFFLVMLWMARLLFSPARFPSSVLRFGLPLFAFIGLVCFQLLPLPPALLQHLSPSTYEVYTKTIPGWPAASDPATSEPGAMSQQRGLASADWIADTENASSWRSISVAPELSRIDLMAFLAYTSLFFLVLLYPFDTVGSRQSAAEEQNDQPDTVEWFIRAVCQTVLCAGLLIAVIGLVQRYTWNGKILWFFVAYDWHPDLQGSQSGTMPRASGPFINSVHFANYLSLVFPLAVGGLLSRRFLSPPVLGQPLRVVFGVAIPVLLAGILLSFSRGAWLGAAAGLGLLLWLYASFGQVKGTSRSRLTSLRRAGAALGLLLFLTLFFVGRSDLNRLDVRLEQTLIPQTGVLEGRETVWQDSIRLLADFPLVGVGLGAWPELFPRYQRPPWSSKVYREAHNDYVELLTETGLIGFGLLAWFFWRAGIRLRAGLTTLPAHVFPVFAALLAALAAMAVHAFFDFPLQIPANAFLFTLLFALALRVARNQGSGVTCQEASAASRITAVGTGVSACVLCVLALRYEALPYPYNLKEPTTIAQARQTLRTYPTHAATHLSLFYLLSDAKEMDENEEVDESHGTHRTIATDEAGPPLAQRFRQLEAALWLNPNHPYARDVYAYELDEEGNEKAGLQEITQSVFASPELATHYYLDRESLPDLEVEEIAAIESGFIKALTAGFPQAPDGLAAFYGELGRFTDEAAVYEQAAKTVSDPETRQTYLLNAGLAYAEAQAVETAENLFRRALQVNRRDPRAYQYLATQVWGPRKELDKIKTLMAQGIGNGADASVLLFSLAEVAQQAGDVEEAESALLQAINSRVSLFEAHFRLARLYLHEKRFDRAVLSLRQAARLRPQDANVFYHLGRAEEGRYRFFAAQEAYARAAELAPDNAGLQQRYQSFLDKVAQYTEQGEG